MHYSPKCFTHNHYPVYLELEAHAESKSLYKQRLLVLINHISETFDIVVIDITLALTN